MFSIQSDITKYANKYVNITYNEDTHPLKPT